MAAEPYLTNTLDYYPLSIDELNFFERFYHAIIFPVVNRISWALPLYSLNRIRKRLGASSTHWDFFDGWKSRVKLANTIMGFDVRKV